MNIKELALEDLICPFCGDMGFDAVGLKAHFFSWCEKFDEVESLEQERIRLNDSSPAFGRGVEKVIEINND